MKRLTSYCPRLALLLVAAVAFPLTVTAATLDFQVLLDVDNNPATGCTASGMTGVDQVIASAVTTTETTGTVTSMGRRVCTGGVLGPLLDVDTSGYGAGYNPNSGQMVVESRVAYAALGSGPFSMRVGFAGQTGASNAILTTNSAQPIAFPEPSHGRRRPSAPSADRFFVLDGLTQDWGTIAPLASGNAAGQPAFRLSQAYGYGDGQFFWFRIDANLSKNPPPTAVDDAYSVRQGQALVVPAPGVLLNDSDPSGLPLTAQVVTNPTHGTLSFNSNGGFAYVNDGAFVTSDSFEYRASNGSADSNTAKVVITILPNGVPQAFNDSYNVAHRGTLNVAPPGVLSNDVDPDGDPLTAIALSSPANGSLTLNGNGSFVYTHNGSNTLTDSFQYAASDNFSQSNPAQVSITIAANIPPTAVGDAYSVPEGGTLNQTAPGLFANDSDPDTPQSLWVAQVVTPPVNGTLTMGSGGAFTYVHNGGETTSDSFVYRVNDGIANSNNATVAITITPVNDAPVAVNDAYNTNEDTPLTIVAPGLLANDTDAEGTTLTSTRVANATNGNAVVNANGSFTYTPNANFNGVDTFTYTASDGVATSNVATVTITVAAVNDAPVFTAGPDVTVLEDSGAFSAAWATGVGAGGGADESGQTLTFNVSNNNNGLFSTQPAIAANGTLSFTPALHANGSATITVSLSDNGSNAAPNVNTSAAVNFTITVTAVNDVPSFTKGPDQTVNEDAGAQTVDPWATAISRGPADESGQTLNFNISNNNNALFSAQPAVSPTGVLTYTPAADAFGSATVTISLSDTGGIANGGVDTSASQTFTITVTPVNDAPVVATSAGTMAFVEDSPAVVIDGALTISDIDSATLVSATVTITNLLDAGQETLAATVGATGITANYVAPTLTLTGSSSLANYQAVLRTITYNNASNTPNTTNRVVSFQVNDGAAVNNLSNIANKTVSVAATNDAPVVTASAGTTAFTEDGGAVVVDGTVTVTDADHANLTSATVTITNLQDGGAELLAAPTLLGGVTANYVAPTLTLTGSATVAEYQTMLRAVTYNNTSNTPTVVARTIAFQVTDGVTASAASNKTVSITVVNDAPVVTTSGGTTAFTENGSAVWVDNNIGFTVTDVDSTNLVSATVTITNPFDPGAESLTAPTLLGGVTANYAAPTLTLTGSASLADYQAMLRGVRYDNGSNTPNTTNRIIRFQVNDGAGVNNLSNQADKTVSVTATNDKPWISSGAGGTLFTEDGGPVVLNPNVGMNDPDNTTFASATVTISNLLNAGAEFLAAPTLLGGVTANYVAPTLTLTGTASIDNYRTMLQAVTYNNTSQNPNTTLRAVAFVVNDGAANSDPTDKFISITAVNDAPVVTASGGTTAFVEDAGAVAVDGAITVTDVDSTNLASATVTITNLLDAGVETLVAPTLLGAATANYVAPTLTISGAATVAQYQTMLRAVTYNNASNNPTTTNRTIRFQANDGAGVNNLSNQSDKLVSVAAMNDAPVVTASGGTTAFTEDGGAVTVDTGVTVSDVDNTNLASATVTITNLLDAGVEVLAAPTLLGGVTANYAAPTLTLTGSASLADYQTMLRAVTYNNTSQNPTTTNRILAFVVNDGTTNSAASNKTVSIAAVNDAPVVTASGGTTAFVEDAGAVAVDGAVTVTDIDSTNLASATVTITNLLDAGVETLAAPTLLGAATANYVAPTLTISGAATVAEYQTMLRAVTYNNTSNTPNTTNRVIRFQANDGAGVNNLSNQSDKTLSVAAANDAPVVTASGGTTAFTEDGGAVTVDTGVTVSDVDNTNLASATVTITNLLDAGVEVLAAPTLLGGVTANYAAPTLTLTGSASLADYQTMLRAVTYNNTSQNPTTTNRILAFVVNDGAANSPASNKTVSVAAVNDAPVVTASGGTTAFAEDGAAVAVDNAITVTDIDSANLASATVTITNLLDAGLETLAAPTLLGAATANYVAPTLTISGAATVAEYQTMLRAVTYTNASNNPNTTNRTIRFQANDGAGVNNLSNQSDKTLSVAATNDAPVVTTTAGTVTFTEAGGAIVIDNGVTVTDVDSATIASATVTITNLLDAGMETLAIPGGSLLGGATANYVAPTLTISGTTTIANYELMLRAVTYNNASTAPNTTQRSIGFQVNDGAGVNNLSNTATRGVVIVSVNSQPVITTSGGTTAFVEDSPAVAIDGALTVTDPDTTTLASATVTISNLLDAGLETLNAPTLLGGATANYAAPTLTITGTTTLANYETMLRAVTYSNASNTPNTTNRVINFQGNDGQGANNLSNVASKTVSVAPSNDAPVVATSGGSTSFTEGGGAVVVDSGVTVSDVDSAMIASATATISNLLDAGLETLALGIAPLGGATANYVAPTLTISGATTIANYQTMLAAVTYNNSSNNPNTTARTINFQVTDGAANSNVAGKSVSVTGVNSAPVVTTSGGTTAFVEDAAAVAIDGALTVTDGDSPNLTQATITITNLLDAGQEVLNAPTLLGGATANYAAPTLTISGSTTVANYETMLRAVTYNNSSNTPNTTNRVIAFQVTDGTDASNTANKTVSVAATNDAPVVVTTGGSTGFTEDGGAVTIDSGVTVTDVDSANLASATVTITNLLDAGVETLAAPTLLGAASANYVAPTLTISGAATVAEYQTMLAAVTYNNTSQNPSTTARVIAFVANDGTNSSTAANKTVTVTGVNDAPVVTTTGTTTAFTEDGGAVAVDTGVTVTDIDSTNLASATVTITNIQNAGVEILNAPTLLGAATANYVAPTLTISGAATVAQYQTMLAAVTYNNTSQDPNTTTRVINFQVNDGGGVNNLSNTASKNVSVAATNDPPTPNAAGPFNAQAGMKVTFPAGTLGGTDVEPGTTVTVSTTPGTVTNGTVLLNANGSFEFTPTPGSAGGTASFQYNVCDNGNPGPGVCSTTPVTVTLNVAGPAIFFVTAAGAGTACTVPAPCTLATAVTQIGANTNRKIFIMDNGTHNAAVPLNAQGWLIGQGVTGVDFDTVFTIVPGNVSPGTLDARPAINGARPTIQQTVSLNATTVVRGVSIVTTTAVALNDVQVGAIASLTVNDSNVGATGFTAINLSAVTGAAITLSAVNGSTAANAILLNDVAGAITVNGGTFQNTTSYAVSLTNTGSLTTTLSGVTFSGTCLQGIGGTTFGTLSVSGVTVNAINEALVLNTGAVNGTFTSVSAGGGSNNAPVILTAVTGNFTVSGGTITDSGVANPVMTVSGGSATIVWNGAITQATAAALVDVSGTHTGNITFGGNLTAPIGTGMIFTAANGTYSMNGTNAFTNGAGVNISGSSTGNFTFGSGTSITNGTVGANSACLTINGSNLTSFTYNGNLTKNAAVTGRLIDITNVANTAGTFTFQTGTLSTTSTSPTSTGILLSNVDNPVNFSGTTTLNGGGGNSGVDINTGSGGAFTFNSSTQIGNVSSASGVAFDIDNAGVQTTVTYNGTINTTLNRPVSIQNVGNGSAISFTGNVTSTSNGILVQTVTGTAGSPSSVTFSGGSKSLNVGANTAVTYAGAANVTLRFNNGGLVIARTTGAGVNATTGGTLIITRDAGAANTIGNGTSGTALSVANVTIGTGGLVFQSIDQNGGANGIFLQNTGSTAGLTVAGNSAGNCGGSKTLTPVAGDCTGGTIQSINGGDGTTSGVGIYLENTQRVSLTRMRIMNCQNFAIKMNNVTKFTGNNLFVTGANGTSTAFDEGGVDIVNLLGTSGAGTQSQIDFSTFQGSIEFGFQLMNNTGTLDRLTMDNITITQAAGGDDGLQFESQAPLGANLTLTNSRITSAPGDLLNATATNNGTMDVVVTNNSFDNTLALASQLGGGGSVTIGLSDTSDITYNLSSNSFSGGRAGLLVRKGGGGTPTGTMSGSILNNTVGSGGASSNGASEASGIEVDHLGSGYHRVMISGNNIRNYGNYGIYLSATDSAAADDGQFHIIAKGNTLSQPFVTGVTQHGLYVENGTTSAGLNDNYTICADLGSTGVPGDKNNVSGSSAGGGVDLRVRGRFQTTTRLPGFPDFGGQTVDQYLTARNNLTTVSGTATAPATIVGGAACTFP